MDMRGNEYRSSPGRQHSSTSEIVVPEDFAASSPRAILGGMCFCVLSQKNHARSVAAFALLADSTSALSVDQNALSAWIAFGAVSVAAAKIFHALTRIPN